MKKIVLSLAFWAAISASALAQVKGNAIGVRGGIGSELSYQHKLSGATRMEFDLGWYFNHGLNVAAVHHWAFDLSELATGFNWYLGVGPQVGFWTYNNEGLAVGVAGQIGLEYNFIFHCSFHWIIAPVSILFLPDMVVPGKALPLVSDTAFK